MLAFFAFMAHPKRSECLEVRGELGHHPDDVCVGARRQSRLVEDAALHVQACTRLRWIHNEERIDFRTVFQD
jgi:hypothetical protein